LFDWRTGFVGVRVLTPEEIVEANENGKKIIVQLAFYSVFTVLLSVCALYRRGRMLPAPCTNLLS
jgi:succinate-acetate transporter protein